ncbi:RNA polymerase I-specific transcription initiation factor RRN7 [Spathaspora sp. JA1]|nr:RNA polymerase I-specific transcription initiation factor RRN7 [Spathaspora sp. JA1]
MAKSTWFRGPVCGTDNCRSRLYRSSDGLTICQFGHVLEGAVEFNDDQDQAIVSTRRLNAAVAMDARGSYTSSQQARQSTQSLGERSERLFGSEALSVYYRCLQILLKYQLNVFIKLFCSESMTKDLTCLVKSNWMDVLSDVHKSEDDGHIDTLDLIVIIYISSLQLQAYSIYTSDILDHILSNEIPYVRTLHLVPQELLDKLPTLFHNRLQPYNLPTKNQIYKKLKITLGRVQMDMTIPTSFYFPFIFKTCSQTLILPNSPDLFMSTYKLLQLLEVNSFTINYTAKKTNIYFPSIPEIYLSSIMVFIIKLSFYNNKYSINNWLTNLSNLESTDFISDETNLLDWSDSKVENYCDWIYDSIIPKKYKLNESNSTLSTLDKRLFQIFKLEKDDEDNIDKPTTTASTRSILNHTSSDNSNQDFQKLEQELLTRFSKLLGLDIQDFSKCYQGIIKEVRKKTKVNQP